MYSIINITSQGQISIPAKARTLLGLSAPGKVMYTVVDNKLVIEPVKDLLSLGGVFKDKAMKGKSIDEIIAIENKALQDMQGSKI